MSQKTRRKWRVSITYQHPSGSIRNADHVMECETLKKVSELIDCVVGDGNIIHTRVKEIKDGGKETLVATASGGTSPAPKALPAPKSSEHEDGPQGMESRPPKLGKKNSGSSGEQKRTSEESESPWYASEAFKSVGEVAAPLPIK